MAPEAMDREADSRRCTGGRRPSWSSRAEVGGACGHAGSMRSWALGRAGQGAREVVRDDVGDGAPRGIPHPRVRTQWRRAAWSCQTWGMEAWPSWWRNLARPEAASRGAAEDGHWPAAEKREEGLEQGPAGSRGEPEDGARERGEQQGRPSMAQKWRAGARNGEVEQASRSSGAGRRPEMGPGEVGAGALGSRGWGGSRRARRRTGRSEGIGVGDGVEGSDCLALAALCVRAGEGRGRGLGGVRVWLGELGFALWAGNWALACP